MKRESNAKKLEVIHGTLHAMCKQLGIRRDDL